MPGSLDSCWGTLLCPGQCLPSQPQTLTNPRDEKSLWEVKTGAQPWGWIHRAGAGPWALGAQSRPSLGSREGQELSPKPPGRAGPVTHANG